MDLSTTPTTEQAKPTIELKNLHPDLIAPSPTNPRKTFAEAGLQELASSLLDGQVQPIVVRYLPGGQVHDTFENRGDGKPLPIYELVVGERRWRAAQLINTARDAQRQQPGGHLVDSFELRAEVRALSDLEVVRMQIVENLHREEVHPLEEAEGYDYLMHHSAEGVTVEQLANEVGKSTAYIYQRIKLVGLCKQAREAFYAGKLDASTALLVARRPEALQLKILKEIEGMAKASGGDKPSYRMVKQILHTRYQLALENAVFNIHAVDLVPAAGSCSACPKRTGNQAMLFQEAEPDDVCTDPDCFEAKRAAHVVLEVAAAKKQGLKVIEGEEAAALLPSGPNTYAARYALEEAGFTQLNEEAYTDDEPGADGERQTHTFADLLQRMAEAGGKNKNKIKPTLVVHPDHPQSLPTQVISNEAAQQLLDKFKPKPKPRERTPAELDRERADQENAMQRRVDSLLEQEINRHLLEAADRPRTNADLVGLLFALAAEGGWNAGFDLDKLAELSQADEATWTEFDDDDEATAWLTAHLIAQPPEVLSRIAMCLLVSSCDLPDPVLHAMATSHGMHVEAERTRLQAQVLKAQNDGTAGDDDDNDD